MEIKPLKDRVLIRPKQAEEKTAGGIYIPDSAKEKTIQGEVIEVGTDQGMPVKKGDTVMYESFSGTEIRMNNEKYLIMNIKDIIAIVK